MPVGYDVFYQLVVYCCVCVCLSCTYCVHPQAAVLVFINCLGATVYTVKQYTLVQRQPLSTTVVGCCTPVQLSCCHIGNTQEAQHVCNVMLLMNMCGLLLSKCIAFLTHATSLDSLMPAKATTGFQKPSTFNHVWCMIPAVYQQSNTSVKQPHARDNLILKALHLHVLDHQPRCQMVCRPCHRLP